MRLFLIPIISILSCQIIKFTIESITTKTIKWNRLFNGAGGMPSSHTSFVFSLTFLMLYIYGYESPYFAISLVLSIIIAYDAMGLRQESGKQAVAINKLAKEVYKNKKNNILLKEELGHKPIEVLAGIIYGGVVSYLLNIIL